MTLAQLVPTAAHYIPHASFLDATWGDHYSLEVLRRDATAAAQGARIAGDHDDADDLFTLADWADHRLQRQ